MPTNTTHPTPPNMQQPPLCIDCKYFDRPRSMCYHPSASRSLVDGQPTQPAAFMRIEKNSDEDGPCGRAGQLFEALAA